MNKLDQFEIEENEKDLGHGAFSRVINAKYKENNSMVAIKEVQLQNFSELDI